MCTEDENEENQREGRERNRERERQRRLSNNRNEVHMAHGGERADGSQGLSAMHPASPDIYPVRGQSVRANIGRTWNFGYILRDSSGGAAERSEKQFRSLRCLFSRPRTRRRRRESRRRRRKNNGTILILARVSPAEFFDDEIFHFQYSNYHRSFSSILFRALLPEEISIFVAGRDTETRFIM